MQSHASVDRISWLVPSFLTLIVSAFPKAPRHTSTSQHVKGCTFVVLADKLTVSILRTICDVGNRWTEGKCITKEIWVLLAEHHRPAIQEHVRIFIDKKTCKTAVGELGGPHVTAP
jgi:hypothetical protein